MISRIIFDRVLKIVNEQGEKITNNDILFALTEELGEYSRAVRVEDNAVICSHKTIKESSRVEIIDLMLVCIEAYIRRGGTYESLFDIADEKLSKWERLWKNQK